MSIMTREFRDAFYALIAANAIEESRYGEVFAITVDARESHTPYRIWVKASESKFGDIDEVIDAARNTLEGK